MTAELSPEDLARMRLRHRPVAFNRCNCGKHFWDCDAVRLLDEVERLRGLPVCPRCERRAVIEVTSLTDVVKTYACGYCDATWEVAP